ncbi:MAG TPA: hypothetical protein VMI75_22205 [Polyangiaceae bacterium]|nr:hypothetical protein [Polyangiaceae bacterium]
MHSPYTTDFLGAFIAAQSAAALLLTALLLFARMPLVARLLLLAGAWLAALALLVEPLSISIGGKPDPKVLREVFAVAACLGIVAAMTAMRPGVAVLALLGEWPLWKLTGYLKDSDADLSALHLAWMGLLVGLIARSPVQRPTSAPAPEAQDESSYALHDAVVFVAATVIAALVCLCVLHKRDGSADEWAYTFQAAVLAKGHAFAASPRCEPYLESFYVYERSGRLFSQYPPGWPLFITPFVWIRAVWLSGPVSMGFMAWGMARLGRTAMRGFGRNDAPPSERLVRAAGTWAAVLAMLSTTMEINGASRYPHVFVVGLYAWSLEAILQLAWPGLSRRRQVVWGSVLGGATVLLLATRPADGAFVGLGLAGLFFYEVARKRVGWRGFAATAGVFAGIAAFVLVVLRLQVGRWFATGYSLNEMIHPWNAMKYSFPKPEEWRYGLRLATGSYCWWPCSLPVGLAGLALLRGRSLGLASAIGFGCLPYLAYCCFLEYGRGYDWGYGPRFQSVLLVPMAFGGAVALAPLAIAAFERAITGRTALARGGPFALAVCAVAGGWLRIVPLVWPPVYEHTRHHAALSVAIEEAHLTNAVVLATNGTTGFSDEDLTTNYPIDLYPDQDAIIAIDRKSPEDALRCLRSAFPHRTFYEASGFDEIRITRLQ